MEPGLRILIQGNCKQMTRSLHGHFWAFLFGCGILFLYHVAKYKLALPPHRKKMRSHMIIDLFIYFHLSGTISR